jgi:hypothetical protein
MRENMKSMHALSVQTTLSMHCAQISLVSHRFKPSKTTYLFRDDDDLGALDPLVDFFL